MAKQKIATLQHELDAQTAYFKQEEDKHEREVKALRDQLNAQKQDEDQKDDQNSKL